MISICIAFRNEKDQIFKTIESLNNSSRDEDEFEIIVINDCSDDVDYSQLQQCKRVRYYQNQIRLGSSQSKEKAVQLAQSDNIFVLDAHMRFKSGWYDQISKYYETYFEKIYCLNTQVLMEDETWNIITHSCAKIEYGDKHILSATWIHGDLNPNSNIIPVPVVLGASYIFNRKYYNKVKGLIGLTLYGREEEYLSIKSWGMGDGCYLIKDIQVAHLYRKVSPQPIYKRDVWHNILVIAYTLLPNELTAALVTKMQQSDEHSYNSAVKLTDFNECAQLKAYYDQVGFDYNKFSQVNDAAIEFIKSHD